MKSRYNLQSVLSAAGKLSCKRIEALHQYWDPLVQEACLSSLARVQRNTPSKIIKEVANWCVEYAQGLYRNWFKDVAGTEVNVLLLLLFLLLLFCVCLIRLWTWNIGHVSATLSSSVSARHLPTLSIRIWSIVCQDVGVQRSTLKNVVMPQHS